MPNIVKFIDQQTSKFQFHGKQSYMLMPCLPCAEKAISCVTFYVCIIVIYSGTSIIRTPLATGVWIRVWIIEMVRITKINTVLKCC